MRTVLLALLCLASASAACGGDKSQPPPPPPEPAPEEPSPVEVPVPEEPSPFPATTLSLKLKRTVGVRLEPLEAAKRIGTIAIDTRVGWTRTAKGPGCSQPWVQIRPRGWVCAEHLEPRAELPKGDELPRLDRGELVPGTYGKVVDQGATTMILELPKPAAKPKAPPKKGAAGSKAAKAAKAAKPAPKVAAAAPPPPGPITSTRQLDSELPAPPSTRTYVPPGGKLVPGKPVVGSVNVRQYKELVIDGKLYWKISPTENEYLAVTAIHQHKPSEYRGSRLGDETPLAAPLAFVWPRGGMQTAWSRPNARTGNLRQVPRRTIVSLLESATDPATPAGKPLAYRIGPAEWMEAGSLRLFVAAPPPPNLQPSERWIDVDLDGQILVAYEGELPIYATLFSAGTKQTPTETGIYRMWKKMAETDMNGLTGEDPYSTATVPWTQFFSPERGLALHTSYWHDGFGTPKSHGCINLAPADARWLYFWSEPQVPPGWTMAAGVAEAPGSLIRVRSKADPNPVLRGYAKRVEELRAAGAPAAE